MLSLFIEDVFDKHSEVVTYQLVKVCLIAEALNYEFALANVSVSVFTLPHIQNLLLTYLEHEDEQVGKTLLSIAHEQDPLQDASWHVHRDGAAEAQRVHRVVVHVPPHVQEAAVPSFLIKQSI